MYPLFSIVRVLQSELKSTLHSFWFTAMHNMRMWRAIYVKAPEGTKCFNVITNLIHIFIKKQ